MTPAVVLVVVGWLAGWALLWRRPVLLDAPSAARPPPTVALSVIVPARNEEATLPGLLSSLAAQHRPATEVIVVDDASDDRTAAFGAAQGATVVPSGGPPPGWAGKPWACHCGAGVAVGDLLVFLDADTVLAPDALGRLVATHSERCPDGLLSVQPHHVTERPYEQLSALCNVVPVLASGIAAAGPARPARVAFGPCLVVRARDLEAFGGFGAVRGESVEDIALARAARAAGRPVVCVLGADTVAFRMYADGLRSLLAGWTKNLAGGARRAPIGATLGAVLWVCALVTVATQAAVAPAPWVAMAWLAVAGQLAWMLRRLGRFRWWASALFPVPLVAFVGLFVASVVA
nr:glycosyltransferase [Acidimicrobiia bacterium]